MRSTSILLSAVLLLAVPAAGQSTLERSPLLGDDWVGFPWAAELSFITLFDDPGGRALDADPTFQASLGLPYPALLGLRFTPEPLTDGDLGPSTLEGFARARLWSQDAGAPVDVSAEAVGALAGGGWAATLRGQAARWVGPLRLMGVAELDPLDGPPLALGAGALWHVLPGAIPIAVAADVATVPIAEVDHPIAWSAGLHVGLSFTPHTLAIFATNAHTTVRGQRVGSDRTRLGLEVTAAVPVGRFFGAHAPRERATESVRPVAETTAPADEADPRVTVPIREYRYAPQRLVVQAGTTVEWVNEDDVMHTATADDAAWNSGAIPPGARWSATFEEPGSYPYHCGPHPFMRGVVIVR